MVSKTGIDNKAYEDMEAQFTIRRLSGGGSKNPCLEDQNPSSKALEVKRDAEAATEVSRRLSKADEAAKGAKGWWTPQRRITKDVVVLSGAYLLLFTAFKGAANLQSSVNAEGGLGTSALMAYYAGFIISSIFLPAVMIRKMGCKWTMALCAVAYAPFMAANLRAEFYTLVPGALVAGAGAGPAWCALSTYTSLAGERHARAAAAAGGVGDVEAATAKLYSLFYTVYQLNQVSGNLLSSLVLSGGDESNITLNATHGWNAFNTTHNKTATVTNAFPSTIAATPALGLQAAKDGTTTICTTPIPAPEIAANENITHTSNAKTTNSPSTGILAVTLVTDVSVGTGSSLTSIQNTESSQRNKTEDRIGSSVTSTPGQWDVSKTTRSQETETESPQASENVSPSETTTSSMVQDSTQLYKTVPSSAFSEITTVLPRTTEGSKGEETEHESNKEHSTYGPPVAAPWTALFGSLLPVGPEGAAKERAAVVEAATCGAALCGEAASGGVSRSPPPAARLNALCGAYLACVLLAAALLAAGVGNLSRGDVDASCEISGEKEKEKGVEEKEKEEPQSALALLAATLQLLRRRRLLLLLPVFVFFGAEKAFVGAEFTAGYVSCVSGVASIGFVMICYGLTNSGASAAAGWLGARAGRRRGMAATVALHGALLAALLAWAPRPGASSAKAALYVLAAVWGVVDGLWLVQINSLVSLLFPGEEEAAFSNYHLWESAGYIVAYGYSAHLCIYVKLYILVALLAAGAACYSAIEIQLLRRKRKELKLSQAT